VSFLACVGRSFSHNRFCSNYLVATF